MRVLTGPGYCPYCGEEIMMACAAKGDVLHLALTLATCGLWGLVWLYHREHARTCVCCQCGRQLPRAALKVPFSSISKMPRSLEPRVHNQSEFNRVLVSRNLVYYVPTNARYHQT